MTATRICLVRHGETEWNAEGRVQGQTDIPLSAVGLAQAKAAADALARHDFSAIYSSDLMRVTQTAEPTVRRMALPLQLDVGLRERHFGIFERMLYTEVRERYPEYYARFRDKDPAFDFETGESLTTFFERSVAAVRRVVERHPGEHALIFTHGGVLEMIYRHAKALGLSSERDFGTPNAGLNWIEISSTGTWQVLRWADVAHLDGARNDPIG